MSGKSIHAPTMQRRHGFDAVSFLSIYLLLFAAIPSYLTIPALGSIGRLSILWGLAGMVWWATYKVQLTRSRGTPASPVKIAFFLLICALGISYALANLRGLPSAASTTADSSLIRLLSWAGVALVALDGIHTRERLLTLLRRITLTGGLMACLGLAQFATGHAFVDSLTLPGFSVSDDVGSVQGRGDFIRAVGTASHPLEYGSLLCMVLPLAIALAITDRERKLWRRFWPVIAILLAIVFSVSRSTLIGVFVVLVLLLPGMPPKLRWTSLIAGALGMAALPLVVPGLLGTLRGLFLSISGDPSTVSRTSSIDEAIHIALRHPLWGQGFGAFLPGELILDNQFLLILIEGGIIGTLSLLALVVLAVLSARRAAKLSRSSDRKIICSAAAAGTASGLVLLAFFDGLSFPITAGALFVMVSVCGALLEVEKSESRISAVTMKFLA